MKCDDDVTCSSAKLQSTFSLSTNNVISEFSHIQTIFLLIKVTIITIYYRKCEKKKNFF